MEDSPAPSPKKAKRVRPSRSQERRIWDESGSRCQFCGTLGIASLQIHHLDENSANTVDDNLIAICGSCHERYKHGQISKHEARSLKSELKRGRRRYQLVVELDMNALAPSPLFSVGVNHGQVATKIVNNFGPGKSSPVVLPGSIVGDRDRYNYVEYLIARLSKFRAAGASYGQKRKSPVHPGVIRKMVENEWGALPKNLGIDKWERLTVWLRAKIDNTALGRGRRKRKEASYRSFEDFCVMGPDNYEDMVV